MENIIMREFCVEPDEWELKEYENTKEKYIIAVKEIDLDSGNYCIIASSHAPELYKNANDAFKASSIVLYTEGKVDLVGSTMLFIIKTSTVPDIKMYFKATFAHVLEVASN